MNSENLESPMAESYSRTEFSTSDLAVNDQEHGDTQRSLQQASMALEMAYDRIRQVRRNLRELSDSLPSTESIPRFSGRNFNEIEPGHDALLLAGGSSQSGNELSMEQHPSTNHILPQIPPVANHSDVDPPTSGDVQDANVQEGLLDLNDSIYLQPFSTPNTLHTHSRRELSNDMQFLSRRWIDYDAGTTLRGLRVAAREARGHQTRLHNADSAEINNIRRDAPHPAVESFTGTSHRVERHGHLTGIFDTLGGRVVNHPSSPVAPPNWRSSDRRWRMRPEVRVSDRSLQDRTADRFHTVLNPPHSNGPRNVLRLPVGTESRPMDSPLTNGQDRRILERTQSDARDSFIDWSDEHFLSTLFFGQEGDSEQSHESQRITSQSTPLETIRITQTTNPAVNPPERSFPRRGWARLDADGNEISPDEEEELERSRTAYRIQALQRSRMNPLQDNVDNDHIGPIGQNHMNQRSVYGSVLDSTMRIQGGNLRARNSQGGDMAPLYIDPLPMPLVSMNSTKTEGIRPDIFVPKHACLAGR